MKKFLLATILATVLLLGPSFVTVFADDECTCITTETHGEHGGGIIPIVPLCDIPIKPIMPPID